MVSKIIWCTIYLTLFLYTYIPPVSGMRKNRIVSMCVTNSVTHHFVIDYYHITYYFFVLIFVSITSTLHFTRERLHAIHT